MLFSPSCDCCTPLCNNGCDIGTTANTWTVVIAGITNNGCANCGILNGTFTTGARTTNVNCAGFAGCFWLYNIGSGGCPSGGANNLELCLTAGMMTVRWALSVGFIITWAVRLQPTGGPPLDCNVTNKSVTYVSSTYSGCDSSSATCKITANAPFS